jgi:hypothetical protein
MKGETIIILSTIKVDKRYLVKDLSSLINHSATMDHIEEITILEISPNGQYAKSKSHGWFPISCLHIVDQLKEEEES